MEPPPQVACIGVQGEGDGADWLPEGSGRSVLLHVDQRIEMLLAAVRVLNRGAPKILNLSASIAGRLCVKFSSTDGAQLPLRKMDAGAVRANGGMGALQTHFLAPQHERRVASLRSGRVGIEFLPPQNGEGRPPSLWCDCRGLD